VFARTLSMTQRHRDVHKAAVALDPVLGVELMEILPLGADRYLAEDKAVGQDGTDGCHAPLEVTEDRARAAVAGDLLVVIARNADRQALGEMPDQSPFDMKLGSCPVV